MDITDARNTPVSLDLAFNSRIRFHSVAAVSKGLDSYGVLLRRTNLRWVSQRSTDSPNDVEYLLSLVIEAEARDMALLLLFLPCKGRGMRKCSRSKERLGEHVLESSPGFLTQGYQPTHGSGRDTGSYRKAKLKT